MNRLRVAIAGGSGYAWGELARLLLFHPQVELTQVASSSHAGHYLHSLHPNLRKLSSLRFCHPDELVSCDLLFLSLPHGMPGREIERYRAIAPRIIDLSADFRLRSAELYAQWYGEPHCAAYLLEEAVYGLPELHRAELPGATLVSGTGCMATAAILGLAPLYRVGLVNSFIARLTSMSLSFDWSKSVTVSTAILNRRSWRGATIVTSALNSMRTSSA